LCQEKSGNPASEEFPFSFAMFYIWKIDVSMDVLKTSQTNFETGDRCFDF
jgi:hypothetical protein